MSHEKQLRMYNLNVNVATTLPVSFLGLDGQCNTPRTPEIVNSLMAMTNPFDALAKSGRDNNSPGSEESCSGTGSPLGKILFCVKCAKIKKMCSILLNSQQVLSSAIFSYYQISAVGNSFKKIIIIWISNKIWLI